MKIWLSGAAGHMGRAVAEAAESQGVRVLAGVDRVEADLGFPMVSRFADLPEGGDALIDFSAPAALGELLPWALECRVPLVLCTTGYDEAQLEQIREASRQLAIFRSGNMSVGIALLRRLAREAAQVLGEPFDIEITETHHRRKADAPSGTALMLLEAVRGANSQPVFGRHGRESRRQPGEIGVHARRGGTVVGEHEVAFLGDQERICLSHSAESRSVFALGALRAAAFLIGKAPGTYDMDDLLAERLQGI